MGKIWRKVVYIEPKTKKNSETIFINKKTNKPFITMNRKQKAYEKDFVNWINYQGAAVDYPVNVQMKFYMKTRRIVDLVNLQEMCLDCLVRAGVLKDDNSRIVVSMDGSEVLYDKDFPRTEIEVSEK